MSFRINANVSNSLSNNTEEPGISSSLLGIPISNNIYLATTGNSLIFNNGIWTYGQQVRLDILTQVQQVCLSLVPLGHLSLVPLDLLDL